ncbi:MAG TPA: hypothetical protein VLB45_00200 [Nitrosopumilaceae archaeon]|nr:hypothetical protein [Nitrosopumilaceae archaeon]
MNPEIRIDTISISKLGNNHDSFNKYDIEAALEEIENTEIETKVKYAFTLLSNPKNTRINVEGVAHIRGNSSETSQFLEQDKNHLPRILYVIYQELFPLLYTNSLAMQIPCPSYKLAQISSPAQTTETIPVEETVSNSTVDLPNESATPNDLPISNEIQTNDVISEEIQKSEIEVQTS